MKLAGEAEKPSEIWLDDFGNVDKLIRQHPAGEIEASQIAGRYRSDTLGLEATISRTGENLCLTTCGRFGSMMYPLQSLAPRIWRAKPTNVLFLGGVLTFDDDAESFCYSTAASRSLNFFRHSARSG
jgi:hypothetical protein